MGGALPAPAARPEACDNGPVTHEPQPSTPSTESSVEPPVVVPEAIDTPEASRDGEGADSSPDADSHEDVVSQVSQPAKVMRIGTMVKQLLEEAKAAPLDEAARERLANLHARSIRELEGGLSPDLIAELHRISLPFDDDVAPSEPELRIAQAQLVGWLEGLFHGIQTAIVAQQVASQAQGQGRRALPPGVVVTGGQQGRASREDAAVVQSPGQYL